MKTYVLVHGAWLGAWCWAPVAERLRAAGARVIAEDLPGHGSDPTPAAESTLAASAAAVTKLVEAESEPVVLVGHSMAGIVLSSVAERVPERIARLVYVAAYLLQSGESIMSASAQDTASMVPPNLQFAPDYSTAWLKKDVLKEAFCADAGDEDAASLVALAKPEPASAFGTPISVTEERYGRVPRAYVHTTEDRVITYPFQKQMVERMPCHPVLSLPSSHSPFLGFAKELADQLLTLG